MQTQAGNTLEPDSSGFAQPGLAHLARVKLNRHSLKLL